uniref:Uncharacterized protein n=1 Tax=Micrurus lemniscatus lemniscatus TaxID=129467 RepID=A0A2D4IC58_MICLE
MFELTEAIKRQQNKTPGPDGLLAELYKQLQNSLGLVLLEVYNEILLKAKIPQSWMEANVTLIPKEDVDLSQIKNYRPTSLLNVDYKIYTSIIAERLKRFLNECIHPDQNGFLQNR